MHSIRNPKRERFALELYAGKTPMQAMAIAGYTPRAENARRLANCDDVKRRLDALFEAERPFAIAEAMKCRRERGYIAFADVKNYFEESRGEDGRPRVRVKDFTKLPHEISAAIKTIKPTRLGWEITLHDKDASLRAIEDRVDPKPEKGEGMTVNVTQIAGAQANVNDDSAIGRIAAKLAALASRATGEPLPG